MLKNDFAVALVMLIKQQASKAGARPAFRDCGPCPCPCGPRPLNFVVLATPSAKSDETAPKNTVASVAYKADFADRANPILAAPDRLLAAFKPLPGALPFHEDESA